MHITMENFYYMEQVKDGFFEACFFLKLDCHFLFLEKSRVGKGISARAAHGTVREALTSYGSCYLTLFNSKLPVIEQRRTFFSDTTVVLHCLGF